MMHRRGTWTTRIGFYLAAIGCAFGLGNLWRFPYVVSSNGGGAFVLMYLLLAFVIGMPLLIAELILGKYTRQSIVGGMAKITRVSEGEGIGGFREKLVKTKSIRELAIWAARYAVLLSVVVLSYYAVISGWVLHFLMQFTVGLFSSTGINAEGTLQVLMENGWLQILLASVHILITVIVVAQGVKEGMERWLRYVTPLFAVLLVILVFQALALPTTEEALRFLLYPNFSMLSLSSLSNAVGHVFFTLSIGFGTIVTFGSYLREKDNIPIAGFRVTLVDVSISLLAGLLVFPIAIASGERGGDPTLLFKALPIFLSRMEGGIVFGLAFFLCLYLAAVGASIGLLESIVANWVDRRGINRVKATWLSGGVALVLAVVPALSSSVLQGFTVSNVNLLVVFDAIVINWALPLGAFVISLALAWYIPKAKLATFFVDDNNIPQNKLFSDWRFAISWFAPMIILVALILQIVGFFT